MTHNEPLPKFDYDLKHFSCRSFGCVMVSEEIIHQIKDTHDFYLALGFTDDMQKNGEFPEEFIWSKYHKDGAKRADVCLQANIIAYLCKKEEGFNFRYQDAYKNWIGSCTSEKMDDSNDCKSCKKHPKITAMA
jgi:hypothetical protein